MMKTVTEALRQRVEDELLEGEDLLWVGVPNSPLAAFSAGRSLRKLLGVAAGVFAMLLGVVLFSTRSAASASPTVVMVPIVLLVAVFALLAFVLPLLRQLRGGRTVYAVTDQRLLILSGSSVRSYGEHDLDFIERRMRPGGRGDVLFKRELRSDSASGMYGGQVYETPIGFMGIENPREVEALLLRTFRVGGGHAAPRKRKTQTDDDAPDAPPQSDDDDDGSTLGRLMK